MELLKEILNYFTNIKPKNKNNYIERFLFAAMHRLRPLLDGRGDLDFS